MRTRLAPITIAAAVAASALVVPSANAAVNEITATNELLSGYNHHLNGTLTLPTAQPQDVILQVGATQDSVMLNWITAPGISGQVVRIQEKDAPADSAKDVTATAATSKVSYTQGDPRKQDNVVADVAHHKVAVGNLKENTEYIYKVGSDRDGWSQEYTFNTGTYGDSWNFLHFGDVQLYSTKDLAGQTEGWNKTVSSAVERFPQTAFLLSAGDQANHSSMQEHAGFISPEALKQYRTVVNMGNHDKYYADSYAAVYNRPNAEDENYWFEYNNALFISMDTNDWQDFEDDVAFLRKTVAEHGQDKDWIILTYHHATFSQAYHQEDRSIMYWRERMTPIFSELDVDLVLSGHDHIYTRSYLMNGFDPVDAGRVVEQGETIEKKKGEVQYVTSNSSSGSKYYPFFDFKAGADNAKGFAKTPGESVEDKTVRTYTAVWDQQQEPNYTNVEVTKEGLTVTTYKTENGDVVDAFTLKRAAEGKPSDNAKPGSSDSSSKGSSAAATGSSVGVALGVLAALLVALGGGAFWALQQGLIPEQIAAMLPF